MPTKAEKRRAVITDLLIGLGIPILQMISREHVLPFTFIQLFTRMQCRVCRFWTSLQFTRRFWSLPDNCENVAVLPLLLGLAVGNRHCILHLCRSDSWLAFTLWFCCLSVTVRAMYAFYQRQQRFKEIMASNSGLSRGRYLRLMILSSMDLLGTIPLSAYYIAKDAKSGMVPWKSWQDTHSHYHRVIQIPGFIWKNNRDSAQALEMYRWSLVLCAFIFFAFFGFAEEARQNYRRVFTSLASRVGYLTSSGTFGASSNP
jgi:pheromone a factor receptor